MSEVLSYLSFYLPICIKINNNLLYSAFCETLYRTYKLFSCTAPTITWWIVNVFVKRHQMIHAIEPKLETNANGQVVRITLTDISDKRFVPFRNYPFPRTSTSRPRHVGADAGAVHGAHCRSQTPLLRMLNRFPLQGILIDISPKKKVQTGSLYHSARHMRYNIFFIYK